MLYKGKPIDPKTIVTIRPDGKLVTRRVIDIPPVNKQDYYKVEGQPRIVATYEDHERVEIVREVVYARKVIIPVEELLSLSSGEELPSISTDSKDTFDEHWFRINCQRAILPSDLPKATTICDEKDFSVSSLLCSDAEEEEGATLVTQQSSESEWTWNLDK